MRHHLEVEFVLQAMAMTRAPGDQLRARSLNLQPAIAWLRRMRLHTNHQQHQPTYSGWPHMLQDLLREAHMTVSFDRKGRKVASEVPSFHQEFLLQQQMMDFPDTAMVASAALLHHKGPQRHQQQMLVPMHVATIRRLPEARSRRKRVLRNKRSWDVASRRFQLQQKPRGCQNRTWLPCGSVCGDRRVLPIFIDQTRRVR
jgi:hypothetical protein